jgi:hypothetical protein
MDDGGVIAFGACVVCLVPFAFDPETVPSIPIDPTNGRSPDLGGDPARATKQPICPACARRVNPIREAHGLQPFTERRRV